MSDQLIQDGLRQRKRMSLNELTAKDKDASDNIFKDNLRESNGDASTCAGTVITDRNTISTDRNTITTSEDERTPSKSSTAPNPNDISESELITSEEDVCTICFCTRAEDGDLISPCKCRGTQKFVHRACLKNWQAALMKRWSLQSIVKAKYCSVCNAEYSLPPPGARYFAIAELFRSSVMLCFALSIAPFFSFTAAGCLFGMAAMFAIFRAPLVSISILFLSSYVLVQAGLRPAITTHNGRLRIAFTRHGAAVEGIDVGIFLVAKAPHGGIFGRSVILIIEHGLEGTYGLILNNVSTEILEVCEDSNQTEEPRIGGPVPDTIVYIGDQAVDGARRAAGLDIFIGHNRPTEGTYAAFDGSSRWAYGQLDGEVRARSWSWLPRGSLDIKEALAMGAEGKDKLWQHCVDHSALREFTEA